MKLYLQYERVADNKNYIETLRKQDNVKELERLFGHRLTFGTAGIRGKMGPGYSQMNDLVIIQTSQGLASYLLEFKGEKLCKEQGVIIGFDARHNSSRFSRLAALAFLQKGIPVYYSDLFVPTPLVAFGVRHFGCLAGIVITASHNPKNDNGYKVYWSNGSQILSPHDKNIQAHIERPENQQPWPEAWLHECLEAQGPSSASAQPATTNTTTTATTTTSSKMPKEWEEIFLRCYADLNRSYYTYLDQLVGDRHAFNQASNICITYTTMHGVGHTFLSRALDAAGFGDIFAVEMQKKPDPEFSTVKFPNPEEAGALDLAFETAKHANSNLILAVDPDADRCAAALYNPSSGYKRVLTGNEIGALLGWWIWFSYRNHDHSLKIPCASDESDDSTRVHVINKEPKKPQDCYMLSTAVSSKFLQSMANREGFQFVETLTGFKYMGNEADQLIKNGKAVLFAYEEAIGYMVDSQLLDKDGITAAVQVAQCAAYVASTYSRTLEEHLDWLYTCYGYHYNFNSYYLCTDPATIRTIFHRLQSNFPQSFEVLRSTEDDPSGGKQQVREVFQVTRVRDLNSGFDSGTSDHKPRLPTSTSSFMVTFFVKEHNISFTIRTSGTEPKIKFYSEIIVNNLAPFVAPLPDGADRLARDENRRLAAANRLERQRVKADAQAMLHRFVAAAVERCLRPAHYKLEPALGL